MFKVYEKWRILTYNKKSVCIWYIFYFTDLEHYSFIIELNKLVHSFMLQKLMNVLFYGFFLKVFHSVLSNFSTWSLLCRLRSCEYIQCSIFYQGAEYLRRNNITLLKYESVYVFLKSTLSDTIQIN